MSEEVVLGFAVGVVVAGVVLLVLDIVGTWVLEHLVLHLSPALRERARREREQDESEE
ncbi:hypothetical protein [Nocardiopsis composta]|uniref:Uncharacterized protein n=1 Tax=Nocardiopsis composta TaxID=157465 RepID=A0A7W8VCT6_9ACTN|nr:hypothetical protein [Nocardiopsis composta]MBB5431320.1 hypothetical protein [Nocardiopsis composta]